MKSLIKSGDSASKIIFENLWYEGKVQQAVSKPLSLV